MRLAGSLVPLAALTLAVLATGGCASAPRPAPAASAPEAVQPETPVQPAPPPAETAEAATSAEEPTGAYGPKTVIIDQPEGVEEPEARTLAEAAREARASRSGEGTAIAVITDETLPEYATGELSMAAEKPAAEGAGAPAQPLSAQPTGAEAEPETGEAYWRERVRGARLRWRDLLDEITRLESEVAELRRRFYAEDDGFYRDSQIKPAWDRALDRLGETRDEVRRARENLRTILEEGRVAGALPGWLREGIEYEPALEEPDEQPGIHEPSEPQVVEDDGGSE